MESIADLPTGALDIYRNQASFNWKKMKLHLETPEMIETINKAFQYIETEPIFQHPDHDLSFEEERKLTFLRMKKIHSSQIFYPDDYFMNTMKAHVLSTVLGLYDWSLLARKSLLYEFAIGGIVGLGTERHVQYISSLMNLEIGFAFCLTEMSHGTNTKAMRTEARYDIKTKSFSIHTPDFEAAKCWAGCLGKTATHCLVFAQLYTPDGVCHGLHCFIVPVRDPRTLQTYPGLTVFDMGPKVGLNGMDNGVVMFTHYKIPRENLLNKIGDVTEDGRYVSPIKDPNKRFGASLGNLSTGRVGITGFGVTNMRKALTISIRYSAVRKQFGPDDTAEIPVLEYPLQQYRLFPYLAGLYALHSFAIKVQEHHANFMKTMIGGGDPDSLASFGQELHALSCVGKPYSGWMARDAIQESREACGGHGYLKAAGFLQIRNDNDANLTYEGDNNVLLQQTSNFLLSLWATRHERTSFQFPMGTVGFLGDSDRHLKLRWRNDSFRKELDDKAIIDMCLASYEWLICWLCEVTSKELNELNSTFKNAFTAKNKSQIFRAHSLALAYGERTIITCFLKSISGAEPSLQRPLYRLCALFALTRILKHLATFVEGGIIYNDGAVIKDMQSHIKKLLQAILPDAMALIDAFAPPDFFLRSALGNADGKVYEHLQQAMVTAEGALTREPYWQEMSYGVASKL